MANGQSPFPSSGKGLKGVEKRRVLYSRPLYSFFFVDVSPISNVIDPFAAAVVALRDQASASSSSSSSSSERKSAARGR